MQPLEVDTADKILKLNNAQTMKIDTIVSQSSASNDNDGKSVPHLKFGCKNCESLEIVANIDWTKEVIYILRKTTDQRRQKLRILVKHNRFGYARVLLTITLCSTLKYEDKSTEAPLVDDDLHKRLKAAIEVVLGNGLHRFAALLELSSIYKAFVWKDQGLCLCAVIQKDRKRMFDWETVFNWRSSNNLAGLLLPVTMFLSVPKTLATFAQKFGIENSFRFFEVKKRYWSIS